MNKIEIVDDTCIHPQLDLRSATEAMQGSISGDVNDANCVVSSAASFLGIQRVRESVPYEVLREVPVDLFLLGKRQPGSISRLTAVGGIPFRAAETPWPKDSSGAFMRFFCQFNFSDSPVYKDILPGDILAVYFPVPDGYAGGMELLHFEWIRSNEVHTPLSEFPEGCSAETPGSFYGVIHRDVDCEVAWEAYGEMAGTGYHRVPVWNCMKIGGLPTPYHQNAIRTGKCNLKFLCQFSSIQPAFNVPFPWTNVRTPVKLRDYTAATDDYVEDPTNEYDIDDMACLLFFVDDDMTVSAELDYY